MNKTDFIIQDIISKIYQRRFKDNKLPTQREMAKQYNVSRFTIQKVVDQLFQMGVVDVIQGSGIFIREKIIKNPLVFNSLTKSPYTKIDSKVLDFHRRSATKEEAMIFQMDSDVWEFTRARFVDYKLEQVEKSCLPVRLFPDLTVEDARKSIQGYVESQGYKISYYLTQYIPTVVTKEDAELLLCKKGTPAMKIQNRGFLRNGQVYEISEILAIDYSVSYIRPFDRERHSQRLK